MYGLDWIWFGLQTIPRFKATTPEPPFPRAAAYLPCAAAFLHARRRLPPVRRRLPPRASSPSSPCAAAFLPVCRRLPPHAPPPPSPPPSSPRSGRLPPSPRSHGCTAVAQPLRLQARDLGRPPRRGGPAAQRRRKRGGGCPRATLRRGRRAAWALRDISNSLLPYS